jgi:hypothetical protein
LSSGDIVTIHAKADGTPYSRGCTDSPNEWGAPIIVANVSGVTWKAATGETVKMSVTGDFTRDPYVVCGPATRQNGKSACGSVINVSQRSIVDGFTIWGSVNISKQADGTIIQNNDLSGGCDGYDSFPAVIRLTGSAGDTPPSDWLEDVTIRNNKIHDEQPNSAYSAGSTNDEAIMVYSSKGLIVENNEFYNTTGSAIKLKDQCNQHIVRFNFFHDTARGVQGDGQNGYSWVKIYNNIFANIIAQAIATENGAGGSHDFMIYNNTFYNCATDIGYWHAGMHAAQIFNNISYHSSPGQYHQNYDQNWDGSQYTYLDYNDYYDSSTTYWRINNVVITSTLAGWQNFLAGSSACAPDCREGHSVDTNPNFLNGSGSLSLAGDFKRSFYPTNGRSGSYPSIIGAYITGNEVIGLMGKRPVPPKNPR